MKNVDISIGEISLNLNEELIPGKKSSDTQVNEFLQSNIEYNNVKKQRNEKSAIVDVTKYTSFIPEKVRKCCIYFKSRLTFLLITKSLYL